MKKCIFLFFLIIQLPCFAVKTTLPSQQKLDLINNASLVQYDLNSVGLMTAQDLLKNDSSNLNLTNNTGVVLSVYGVYLSGMAFITPGLDCINGIASTSNSVPVLLQMSGAVMPIEFRPGQSIPIGQNFLYNMIYTWNYYYSTLPGTPGCFLPGCSWPNDTPHNWCVRLGAISPDAPYTSSPVNAVKVVPFSWPPSRFDYNYDLIPNLNSYIWLGPITCNDETLTCTTALPQYQSFP